MSLLEKASGGVKSKGTQSQAQTSLFRRALAATKLDSNAEPISSSSPLALEVQETQSRNPISLSAIPTSSALPPIDDEIIEEIKGTLGSLQPSQDSLLAAWSILSTRLPLQAISLFLPRGGFLSLAAQVGFPSGTGEDLPLSIVPSAELNGALLSNEGKALVAPSLGVSQSISLRAIAMRSDSGLVGLWIAHDAFLEACADGRRASIIELLADSASSLTPLSMICEQSPTQSSMLPELTKFHFTTAFRFDMEAAYVERPEFRGISVGALCAAFSRAAERILEHTGTVRVFDDSIVVGLLGSSSQCDSELALFQFTKTLKKSLPFLSTGAFPVGSSMSFDLSSGSAPEGLSRFLAK
jgi:hypothetical protein